MELIVVSTFVFCILFIFVAFVRQNLFFKAFDEQFYTEENGIDLSIDIDKSFANIKFFEFWKWNFKDMVVRVS